MVGVALSDVQLPLALSELSLSPHLGSLDGTPCMDSAGISAWGYHWNRSRTLMVLSERRQIVDCARKSGFERINYVMVDEELIAQNQLYGYRKKQQYCKIERE